MTDFFPPTRDQILAEVARELALRRKVFPRWVDNGKLKKEQADERIHLLQAAHDFIRETMPKDYKGKPY